MVDWSCLLELMLMAARERPIMEKRSAKTVVQWPEENHNARLQHWHQCRRQ